MKRLFTIFLSALAVCSLYAQPKSPIAIYGDVWIATGGQMNSEGAVHFEAGVPAMPTGVAKVANYGSLQMKDSVIFYSNDSIDGLLMNQNTATNPANMVVVRKYFAENKWYMMAFPFTVNMGPSTSLTLTSGVKNALDGKGLQRGDGATFPFDVQYYDAQLRANRGVNLDSIAQGSSPNADQTNWQRLDTVNKSGRYPTMDRNTLLAGSAYRIAVMPQKTASGKLNTQYGVTSDPVTGGAWIDFIGTQAADITKLFSKTTKGVNLSFATPVYAPGQLHFTDASVGFSEGWNVFGGLSSTEYILAATNGTRIPNATIDYQNTIYYRDDAAGTWKELNPQDQTDSVKTMRPYAPLFVQTKASGGSFQYLNGNGLTLDRDPSAKLLLRSSSSVPYGQIKLNLSNSTNSAATYFKFNNSYSTSYSTTKDDLMMSTASTTVPIVYSLVPTNDTKQNMPIFNHGVPYTESVIPLGVNIPKTGTYTFSLREVFADNSVVSVVLKDSTDSKTIKKTELLKGAVYTISSINAGTYLKRFTLYINSKVMTNIDQIDTQDVYAYTDNNTLTVKNLTVGDKVQVTDVTGRVFASGIASGDTYSTALNQKGVYIVNVRGEKATVLKVLNK